MKKLRMLNHKDVVKLKNKYPNSFNYVRIVEWPFELGGGYVLSFNKYGYPWADGCGRLPEEMTAPVHEWMHSQGWPALETGKYACRFNQTYKEIKSVLKKIEKHILNPFHKVDKKIEKATDRLNDLEKIEMAGQIAEVEWAKTILRDKDVDALKKHPVQFHPDVRDIPLIMKLEHQLMMLERRKG